jgi:hypothetical protein
MSETDNLAMNSVSRTSGDAGEDISGAGRGPVTTPAPLLRDFLAGPETRLRDLLAFGMAAEGGRLPPDGIEGLRRQADADLQAHAFRILHNQVETIRRQAVDEQIGRVRGGLGFGRAVLANLLALAIAGVAVLAFRHAGLSMADLAPVTDRIAQLLAQFSAR